MRLTETILGETVETTDEELRSRNPGATIEAFLDDPNILKLTIRCRSHGLNAVTYRKVEEFEAMVEVLGWANK